MAKMTKAQAFKRLREAQMKIDKVMLSDHVTTGQFGKLMKIRNDIGNIGKQLK